jgi:hypothetical protein
MKKRGPSQDLIKEQILKICENEFASLGDICRILDKNKNTIRANYIYPMVTEGVLVREHPAGTKKSQRYKAAVAHGGVA